MKRGVRQDRKTGEPGIFRQTARAKLDVAQEGLQPGQHRLNFFLDRRGPLRPAWLNCAALALRGSLRSVRALCRRLVSLCLDERRTPIAGVGYLSRSAR